MKECNVDQCEGHLEGHCIMDTIYKGFNPEDCDCKSNSELMTEEEYEKYLKSL